MPDLASESLRPLMSGGRALGSYHSLPWLEEAGLGRVSRLPLSLRIVLESLLRHAGRGPVSPDHVRRLAAWRPGEPRTEEIPFMVARVVAPDASGVPFLADLAAMRDAARDQGYDPHAVQPVLPVDLVVDHSLLVERAGSPDGLLYNMREEYRRNRERYVFLKWAAGAFRGFNIVPPGVGIVHQVNLERLASGVRHKDGVFFPDTLVGTDSHTPMVNGIGVLGWGAGGIEAEAAMLGEPVYFLVPDVVGVHLRGALPAGATATDLVLTVTERLRRVKVVGKFVEFFGEGAARLAAADRCTLSNMAPEYGATAGYFPVDGNTLAYLESVGREPGEIAAFKAYFQAQRMFGMPAAGEIDYGEVVEIDLAEVVPSVAGPSRPQDRIALSELKPRFERMLAGPVADGGFGRDTVEPRAAGAAGDGAGPAAPTVAPGSPAAPRLRDGDIVLAAITSCSNTSNPGVLLAAGLLARKAVQNGLRASPQVKTSFTPGSRAVESYLTAAGLQPALDRLGFNVVGYACATCMGNSGPLPEAIESQIAAGRLVVASVLSGNRNFEARIHPSIRANFLMSPPLVVAFAIAGRIDFDPAREPLGTDPAGRAVYLRDIWPSDEEIQALMGYARDPGRFRRLYADFTAGDDLWRSLRAPAGAVFDWDPASTYLRRPPFFDGFEEAPPPVAPVRGARALAILGDSVTTDHVSPGSAIAPDSPAGAYLRERGVMRNDFNSYIGRRTNHEVMMRGTFANVRLRNRMAAGAEGGITVHQPDGRRMSIYDAAMTYAAEGVPLVVIAGEEYGTGSSRDWAAKGPSLLGVRVVLARSFERIHRSNLVGMGILPCQFMPGEHAGTLALDGSETFDLLGMEKGVEPRQELELVARRADGSVVRARVLARIDTPVEAEYFRHGGIMPCLLRKILKKERREAPRG